MSPAYPAYACCQSTELAKSTDRRRHLNYLLHDYSEENKKVYGSTMPQAGSNIKPVREVEDTKPRYKPLEGEAAISRQLAAQVNNKRTPTGQFFTTINPTLYEKQAPPATYEGTNMADAAASTLRNSGRLNAAGGGAAAGPAADPSTMQGSNGAGGGTTFPPIVNSWDAGGKRASWLLPWQTGDRQLGRAMADSIRHKRTPIGAFANRDLAKPNK